MQTPTHLIREKNQAFRYERVASYMIDLCVIVSFQLTLGSGTLWFYRFACAQLSVGTSSDTEMFISQFCGGFFFISYFTLSVGLFGNTVGKFILKIKVVNEKDLSELTMPQAYWRSMGYLMSSWTYMVGFILPWVRKDKKALHDLLCGTLVVKEVQNAKSNALPLALPQFASVHPIKTPTKQEAPSLAQTGTDR
jgi:uncharacterized RDD family membrane protein YckC